MPSRIWSHLCEYATIDTSGKATIIGEFDRIFVRNVPIKYPFFFIISKWNGYDREQFTYQIKIRAPSGKEVVTNEKVKATIRGGPKGNGNHTMVSSFMMVLFPEFGEYAIDIIVNDNPAHILSLTIVQKTK